MQTFKYTARESATGKRITSEIQAASELTAAKILQGQGLSPIEIVDINSSAPNIIEKFKNRITIKDKVLFTRQLSTLINAGLPLVQSLRTVGGQSPNKALKKVIGEVITSVEAGSALSKALAEHPDVFNDIYTNLVAAGETSGTLDKSLERLANQQEKDAEIIRKVQGAMVYPVIVMLVMAGVVTFMLVKVMPQVEMLYKGMGGGADLPLVTKMLLAVSNFIIKRWYIVLVVIGLIGFFGSKWARTMGGKRVVDRFKMHAPPLGKLFMKVYMARFARTSTTLIASGVPLIQVLEITSKSMNNIHLENSMIKAIDMVKGGKSLSESISDDPNFLPLVPDMLRIGEQSGAIEQMMEKTAAYYEKEVDEEIKAISTIIEPMLMVMLGVVALIIVAAVLLPIYSLAAKGITM